MYIENISTKSHPVKSLRLYVMKNNLVGIETYKNLGMNNSGYLVYEKTLFPTIEPPFSKKNLSDWYKPDTINQKLFF